MEKKSSRSCNTTPDSTGTDIAALAECQGSGIPDLNMTYMYRNAGAHKDNFGPSV